MKFITYLSALLLVPVLSFSEGDTNTVPEQSKEAAPVAEKKPVSVPELTYFVHQEDTGGCGSAFLFEDEEGVWLVSNVHVFSGSTNLALININGNKLKVPAQIEVAEDRDIIRFLTDQPRGLSISPSCDFDEVIYAYGDSGGAGVLTKLEGKIVAPGPDRVEISAEIIPGNSGGPVVNVASEVVGVSSYLFRDDDLPDWIAEGTRFKDTRRMALRLNGIEWESVGFTDFYRQTLALETLEGIIYTSISIAVILSEDITTTMYISSDNSGFESWLKKHNRFVERSSDKKVRDNIANLAKMLERLEGNPTSGCEITSSFLKGKLEDMKEACEATRKQLEMLAN